MGSGEAILKSLMGVYDRPEDTLYGGGAELMAGSVKHLINPYGSAGGNIGLAVGGGLLSGLLAGLAKSDAADTNAELRPLMRNFIGGDDAARQAIIAGPNGDRFRHLDAQLLTNALENKLEIQKIQELAPAQAQAEYQKQNTLLPIEVAKRGISATGDLLKDRGQVMGPNGDIITVDSPADKSARDAAAAAAREAAVLAAKARQDRANEGLPPTPKRIADEQDNVRKEITALPAYKRYDDIKANFDSLVNLRKENSKAASIQMVQAFARIGDPMSTVREGEYKINSATQGWLDGLVPEWKSVVTGEASLSEAGKKKLIGAASQKYNAMGAVYEGQKSKLLNILESRVGKGTASGADILTHKNYSEGNDPLADLAAKRAFAMDAKMRGLSKEQAEAEWATKGGQ